MLSCVMAVIQSAVIGACIDSSKEAWRLGWNIELVTILYSVRSYWRAGIHQSELFGVGSMKLTVFYGVGSIDNSILPESTTTAKPSSSTWW